MGLYTREDLENVKAAVMALATGERVVKYSFKGRTMEKGQADLPQLRTLLSEIQSDLKTSQGGRTILISTSKGL